MHADDSWVVTWGPVVATGVAATLALVGVAVTVLVARRTFREEQAERRRDRQRDLIAELIGAVREEVLHRRWSSPLMAVANEAGLFSILETDAYKRIADLAMTRECLLVRLKLEIRDPRLLGPISQLDELSRRIRDDKTVSLIIDTEASDADRKRGVRAMIEIVSAIDLALTQLERAAVELLPVHIAVAAEKADPKPRSEGI